MYDSLQKKVLKVAETYADLIQNSLCGLKSEKCVDQATFDSVLEGIRILHHAVVMLTKIDRLCNGVNTGGQEEL